MKVLLLQPFKLSHAPIGGSSYPLGLGYVAASLIKSGIKVSMLDCYLENPSLVTPIHNSLLFRIGLADHDIQNKVLHFDPDVVGINIGFSVQLKAAEAVASLLKAINANLILVAGGVHVSSAPESLNNSNFDYLVTGEGEEAFPRLVNALHGNPHDIESIPGVYYRDPKGDFTSNEPSRLIMNLDDVPFPSYDLMPFEKIWARRSPYANIIATRGCHYNCCFCSVHAIMGRKIRRRSIKNILEEIDLLVHRYHVKEIFFEDDNFTANMDEAKKLFECLCRKPYHVEFGFRNGIRADRIDKELLTLMRRAGCARVCFAPESGSQEVLNNVIDKRLKLEDVEKAVVTARKVGLNVSCFFVIGTPGETKEDLQKTVNYSKRLKMIGCDTVDINCAVPYPGTRLYRQCLEKNQINKDFDWSQLHTAESIINTEEFSAHDIMAIRLETMELLKETKTEKFRRCMQNFGAAPVDYGKRFARKLIKQSGNSVKKSF